MNRLPYRALAACVLASVIVAPGAARAATAPVPERNDYANAKFGRPLATGLQHFYRREFKAAEDDFERALAVVPDNTLAIAFVNAAAAQQGALDALTDVEEDAATASPTYVNHVRLAMSYLFQSAGGRDRSQDARDELSAAVALAPGAAAAHVGLGILRFDERTANRAKSEFLAALRADPNNVLAREYLGQLYQTDLRDPRRGLAYAIDVPNLVPQYADIDFHIGSLLYDLHEPDTALAYLKRGLALDVEQVGEAGQHGYTLVARIYIEQHRLAEATKALGAAVAGDSDAIYAKTLLEKIKSGDYATPPPAARAPR